MSVSPSQSEHTTHTVVARLCGKDYPELRSPASAAKNSPRNIMCCGGKPMHEPFLDPALAVKIRHRGQVTGTDSTTRGHALVAVPHHAVGAYLSCRKKAANRRHLQPRHRLRVCGISLLALVLQLYTCGDGHARIQQKAWYCSVGEIGRHDQCNVGATKNTRGGGG